MLGLCGHEGPNAVAFKVFFHRVGDVGASNLPAWPNGIPRYCTRVLSVFKVKTSPRTGPFVVFTIGAFEANTDEVEAAKNKLSIFKEIKMLRAIFFPLSEDTKRQL